MLIEFRAADRLLSFKALGIYQKGIDAAKAANEKVYVDAMALDEAATNAEMATRWLGSLDEMEPGEVRDVDMAHPIPLTLRTAASVYLTQLGKLAEKESDMLVPLDNTNEIMSQLRSLADRLAGQVELRGIVSHAFNAAVEASEPREGDDMTATISLNGGPAIPMQQFERGVKAMSKSVR